MNLSPVVEISGMRFSYDSRNDILSNVNLKVEAGQSCCIVGPNGGGKSTLLKLLLGLISPQSGSIRIFGKTPTDARSMIGYMPQYHQLDSAFPVTALEVALMGRMRPGLFGRYSAKDREAALSALAEVGIGRLRNYSFSELSGGQRQRVLIARALACAPSLLLLDEPTANIDPGAEEQFYATLGELRKRMTVLTVSHDMGFVNNGTDLVICVNRTVSIHHAGSFNADAVNEVYHHNVEMVRHNHSCFCNCEHQAEGKDAK